MSSIAKHIIIKGRFSLILEFCAMDGMDGIVVFGAHRGISWQRSVYCIANGSSASSSAMYT
jgi:hypothetical protein